MNRWKTEKQIQTETKDLINNGYIGWIEKRGNQPVLVIIGKKKDVLAVIEENRQNRRSLEKF